jgi:hypothetical protein
VIRNKQCVLRGRVVSPPPNPQAAGPSTVGCPRLLIQYIRNYPPYLEAVSSIRNPRTRHAVVTVDPLNFLGSFLLLWRLKTSFVTSDTVGHIRGVWYQWTVVVSLRWSYFGAVVTGVLLHFLNKSIPQKKFLLELSVPFI